MKVKYPFMLIVIVSIVLSLVACAPGISQTAGATPGKPSGEATATTAWSSLLDMTPVPYASPLPSRKVTPLDGTYARFDPAPPQWWSCLRCADYRPAGGDWRMQFDQGVMRIYYDVTGWKSLASYSVSGDRLFLFNDPYCKEATGEYRWRLVDGELDLEVIEDPCSFELRGRNLSGGEWTACTLNASVSGDEPRGCADPSLAPATIPSLPAGLEVTVHEADVRLNNQVPDVIINASGANPSLPEWVDLAYSDESIYYGNNRVLWMDDDWVEITTDGEFTSLGVQFRGDYVIGWARVLFNGEEVWRGDTTRIWSELKVHGGYIEVSGFGPGEHTLRVERLEVDSRPVVVAFFGLNK